MEPRIQYAQTKDGVSIAFRTLGPKSYEYISKSVRELWR